MKGLCQIVAYASTEISDLIRSCTLINVLISVQFHVRQEDFRSTAIGGTDEALISYTTWNSTHDDDTLLHTTPCPDQSTSDATAKRRTLMINESSWWRQTVTYNTLPDAITPWAPAELNLSLACIDDALRDTEWYTGAGLHDTKVRMIIDYVPWWWCMEDYCLLPWRNSEWIKRETTREREKSCGMRSRKEPIYQAMRKLD